MGKRTERYQPQGLSARLPKWKGEMLHVITWEDITFTGKLIDFDADTLVIQDANSVWYNRRKHRHHIALQSVKEVIRDMSRPW
ncbi:MAG: hypothetical protein AAFR59_05575 [Bacteroidota bacterium]